MTGIIIGFGEIGQGVYNAFKDYHKLDYYDELYGKSGTLKPTYDLMLVCIPYSEYFFNYVKDYQKIYEPKCTMIFSTVPIGTTRKFKNTVHCPVEGKHPNLAESIRTFDRYIGGVNTLAITFFKEAGLNTISFETPETTEIAKLQSTTNYGVNIEYAREVKKVCDKYGVDYGDIKAFNTSYNNLYEGTQYKRYILDPPDGVIGGHCILPNSKLFKKDFDNYFTKILEDNNGC